LIGIIRDKKGAWPGKKRDFFSIFYLTRRSIIDFFKGGTEKKKWAYTEVKNKYKGIRE